MPSHYVWRRSTGNPVVAPREPGAVYEDLDILSRQQRESETAIYAPGGVFYQVPPVPLPCREGSNVNEPNYGDVDAGALGEDAGVEETMTSDAGDKIPGTARSHKKREQQSQLWIQKAIPDMLEIEKVALCTCKEPALQLLSLGLFPCAPSRPTLAVDLNMLEFARGLFQNLAPNTTAWCETVEGFLDSRGFKLKTRASMDTLRIRFGNALQWYATLQDIKQLRLAEVLNLIRETSSNSTENKEVDSGIAQDLPETSNDIQDDTVHSDSALPESGRPSEYLRQRCPLCFGGKNWHQPDELFDGIVCIDANFTQKRRKSQGNAPPVPHQHPETLFVSPEDVAAMQAEVETARPVKHKASANEDSAYEPGMKVPSATLDECHESFTAADSNRVKASTQFFADTGLMALLCRHDRVLWLVNMTSAGEKQYYALCLLKELFQHIPATMRMGVLYDIGCQLHRSCVKYDFLGPVLDRITFGISVFHAYGHQWPCQIVYHPRKCRGFGLSDGEGCERLWSALKALIPSLRVSGYYTRLYAIDTKVRHLDKTSLIGMGQWLQRKWNISQEKKTTTSAALKLLYQKDITEELLRQEWANQIKEQTKPLPRQSKNLADKEIHSIIALKENLKGYDSEIATLEDMVITSNFEVGMTILEVQAQVQDTKRKAEKTAKSIAEKTSNLSLSDQKNLQRLLGNNFLRTRMNALAVKQRIRERLRHRKYELESFGSSYRNTVNHQKLQQHAEQQIKRKEPGIQNLARTYNKLCQELKRLIAARTAPRGARAPSEISLEGLFKLDVDHDIWQDDNLTNDLDSSLEIPGWLGNDDIRAGIKHLLQYDRCIEEERRLINERQSMQEWFTEEWNLVNLALVLSEEAQDPNIGYQFKGHKIQLVHLCLAWKTAVKNIPCSLSQNWGPSDDEIEEAQSYEVTEQVLKMTREGIDGNSDADSDDENPEAMHASYFLPSYSSPQHDSEIDSDMEFLSGGEFEDYEEAELVDTMEGFDLAEEFRQ